MAFPAFLGVPAMPRRLTALVALLALSLCTVALAADDKPKPKPKEDTKGKLVIRWHGQSFFEIITTQGTRIILDPHNIEAYGKHTYEADLVLMSHLHDDHTQTGIIKNIKDAKQFNALKVVDKRQEWNLIEEKFKDVKFYTVGTFHDSFFGMKRGRNGVFVMDIDGLRIVHLGDLGHKLNDAQIKKIGDVDILMVPVGGTYTINGLDAREVIDQLHPRRYVIPMHYGTDIYDDLLTLRQTAFLEAIDEGKVKKLATNQLIVDPKEPAPKDWSIVVLNYEDKTKAEK
jgi:L-ascorbate metabolism protein UlaG (beta-lactamase superfamily)